MTDATLRQTIEAIVDLDASATAAARSHQDRLTKPRGSLGQLEDLSVQLAGLAGSVPPPIPTKAAVAVFVGDHGVHAQEVSPWPQEVTGQMVANFLTGGAVINVLARQAGAEVVVVDVGMSDDAAAIVADIPGLSRRNVRRGTADLSAGPAMTVDEATEALKVGIATAHELIDAGNQILVTGDMGIANTTASAALVAKLTGSSAEEVTGRGTGISDDMHAHKTTIVAKALERQGSDRADALAVLADLGGMEHAALAGFMLAAAARRVPVILDGVIACSAALVAQALEPKVLSALIAGHQSVEPAALRALESLGLRPLLNLDLRLGEGSGAALALPIVRVAAAVLAEVATFDSAGVTDKHEENIG